MALLIWKGPTNALVVTPDSGGCVATDRIRATDIWMAGYGLAAPARRLRGFTARPIPRYLPTHSGSASATSPRQAGGCSPAQGNFCRTKNKLFLAINAQKF